MGGELLAELVAEAVLDAELVAEPEPVLEMDEVRVPVVESDAVAEWLGEAELLRDDVPELVAPGESVRVFVGVGSGLKTSPAVCAATAAMTADASTLLGPAA